MSNTKHVSITATTGMARLQFQNAMTIHHWSGYGDGHIPVDTLIEHIMTLTGYAETKQRILLCDVLIIDEIGLLSCKAFDAIEKICRTIRRSDLPFGGIQMIGGGSFFQLPPVPSIMDPGMYAFQSDVFMYVFPHKINLKQVVRQDEPELIAAINELSIGDPSESSVKFLRSLKRPIPHSDNTVFIYGTNFDVDFYNYDQLQKLNGIMYIYKSNDKGNKKLCKLIPAPKVLPLKINTKVIITRNLENGLVNGLSGRITKLNDDSISLRIEPMDNLCHGLEGIEFQLDKYTFTVRDINGKIIASRNQFPVKCGYATTVDKAQGRTIEQLVVDCYNLWKPAQMAVAIGRAKCTAGLEIQNYNDIAARLKHPQIVHDYYKTKSTVISELRTCCEHKFVNESNVQLHRFTTNNQDVRKHQFSTVVMPPDTNKSGNSEKETLQCKSTIFNPDISVPFDINNFIKGLLHPEVTEIHKSRNAILTESLHKESFKCFVVDAYGMIVDLFETYKIAPKRTKCSYCVMTSKLNEYLTTSHYISKCKYAFSINHLSPLHNRICTKIHFELLHKVAEIEKEKMDNLTHFELADIDENLPDHERAVLRYVSGATVKHVHNKFQKSATESMFSNCHKAQIEYKCCRLLENLRLPQGYAIENTDDPKSLLEILRRQDHRKGLTIVCDDTFKFFKLLYLRMLRLQHVTNLQLFESKLMQMTVLHLKDDTELLDVWCNLFSHVGKTCKCQADGNTSTPENNLTSDETLMEFELEQILVVDMFDEVLQYFCTVHSSDLISQYKDNVINKTKGISLRHFLISGGKKQKVQPKETKYPCGKCHKECIEVELMKRARFEDHSVCCDKCEIWYHLVCLGLKGNEPEIIEGSTLPFFCPSCTEIQQLSDENSSQRLQQCEPSTSYNDQNIPKTTKGKGHGKKSKQNTQSYCSTIVQTHSSEETPNDGCALRRSTRQRKQRNILDM